MCLVKDQALAARSSDSTARSFPQRLAAAMAGRDVSGAMHPAETKEASVVQKLSLWADWCTAP